MTYFVTGATGFIGRRLVKKLLARRGTVVYFLVRAESRDKIPTLLEEWGVGEERAIREVGQGVMERIVQQLLLSLLARRDVGHGPGEPGSA